MPIKITTFTPKETIFQLSCQKMYMAIYTIMKRNYCIHFKKIAFVTRGSFHLELYFQF